MDATLILPKSHGATQAGRIVFMGADGKVVGVQAFDDPKAAVAMDDALRGRVRKYKVQGRVEGKWRIVGKVNSLPHETQATLITPAAQGATGAGRIVFLAQGGEVVGVQKFADPSASLAVDAGIRDQALRYKVQMLIDGKWRMVGRICALPASSGESGAPPAPAPEIEETGCYSLGESATRFLAYGFDFRMDIFDSAMEELSEKSADRQAGPPLPVAGSRREQIDAMREAIIASVRSLVETVPEGAVSIGITGGLDSRLIYSALRHVLPADRIFPFTLGYPGQYDLDFVKAWIPDVIPGHLFVETREITWSLERELQRRTIIGRPGAYSSKPLMMDILYEKGVPKPCLHGFMGDALLGSARIDHGEAVQDWDTAVSQFITKNNRWRLQELFSHEDLKRYLPPQPDREIAGMDHYAILDYGLRQRQRILAESSIALTPYTDARWLQVLLSIENLDERQAVYFEFVREFAPDVFPEIVEFDMTDRDQHKKFRAKFTREADLALIENPLRNDDGTPYFRQLRSDGGGYLHGRQFCDRAEYSNHPGFRRFVDEGMSLLRARGVFADSFMDRVWANFMGGSKLASEQVKGLVSFELNLHTGVISL